MRRAAAASPSTGPGGLRGGSPTRIMGPVSTNDFIPPGPVDAVPGQPQARILVVDDDLTVARVIARMAESLGHATTVAGSVDEALGHLSRSAFDAVLTDLSMPGRSGLDLLRHVQAESPEIPVVLITGKGAIDTAMEAIKGGAYDYLAKPPQIEMLGALLRRAIEKKRMAEEMRHLQREVSKHAPAGEIIGASPQMLEVYKTLQRVAPSRTSVLILGESGTGKELVARKLHERSPRRLERFVAVNVSAIPEGLLESEMFGHVRGAFTGAMTARRGLFDEAHRGTLFLDEIGDLSLPLQAKLLRVIQEHRLKPVGGNEEHEVDVRLVGATHRDLDEMVKRGSFREDLYYRMNVVSISLPPLRERGAMDIEMLVEHFLHEYEQETGKTPPGVSTEAFALLKAYAWPGNVRELENVVERAVLMSTHGFITPEALPPRLHGIPAPTSSAPIPVSGFPPLDAMIERYVEQVLDHAKGNRTRAAHILGISRRTLHRMDERRRRSETSPGAPSGD
jgi:two-component system, NtrC family, response regulator AtoC